MKNKNICCIILLMVWCGDMFSTPLTNEVCVLKELYISSVQNYIDKTSKGKSRVSAKEVIRCSYKYDLDIFLMLSQGQWESHFGTEGRALKTNSVFGVGAWDNGVTINKYNHPNESVEPYAKKVSEFYIRERSVELMLNTGFTTINGKRYASSLDYERNILNMIAKIKRVTNIKKYKNDFESFCDSLNIDFKKMFYHE